MGIKDIIKRSLEKREARKAVEDMSKETQEEQRVEKYKAKEIGLRKRIAGFEEIKRIKGLEGQYNRLRTERTRELGKAFTDVGVKAGNRIKDAVKKNQEKKEIKPIIRPIVHNKITKPAQAEPVVAAERKPEVREEISLLTGKPINKTEREKAFL